MHKSKSVKVNIVNRHVNNLEKHNITKIFSLSSFHRNCPLDCNHSQTSSENQIPRTKFEYSFHPQNMATEQHNHNTKTKQDCSQTPRKIPSPHPIPWHFSWCFPFLPQIFGFDVLRKKVFSHPVYCNSIIITFPVHCVVNQ